MRRGRRAGQHVPEEPLPQPDRARDRGGRLCARTGARAAEGRAGVGAAAGPLGRGMRRHLREFLRARAHQHRRGDDAQQDRAVLRGALRVDLPARARHAAAAGGARGGVRGRAPRDEAGLSGRGDVRDRLRARRRARRGHGVHVRARARDLARERRADRPVLQRVFDGGVAAVLHRRARSDDGAAGARHGRRGLRGGGGAVRRDGGVPLCAAARDCGLRLHERHLHGALRLFLFRAGAGRAVGRGLRGDRRRRRPLLPQAGVEGARASCFVADGEISAHGDGKGRARVARRGARGGAKFFSAAAPPGRRAGNDVISHGCGRFFVHTRPFFWVPPNPLCGIYTFAPLKNICYPITMRPTG